MRLDPGTAALLTLPPLFWAGNAVAARLIVGDVPPVALSLARWVIAAALLLPFAWRATVQHRAALLRHWRILLAIGPLGVGAYNTLQYLALQTSTPLATSLIASSSPVFVLALGAIVFGERTRAAQWTGAALSVAGVVLVMARGDPANLAQLAFVPGDLIMLLANLTWTLYTWLLRRHRPDLPFAPLLLVQIAIGIVAIAPFAALEAALSPARVQWSGGVVLAMLYMAVAPSLIAYWCWDLGIRRVGAVIPVYFANLTPVFAALLSMWLLADAPHLYHLAALALIIGGIHLASRPGA
ncbi:MAG: DMT family transporter [Burkholderiales bacterium]|nr:DMT family transporter [Burkholderiales bacterium]